MVNSFIESSRKKFDTASYALREIAYNVFNCSDSLTGVIFNKPYFRKLGMRKLSSYELEELEDDAIILHRQYGIKINAFNAKSQYLILMLHGVDEDTVGMFKKIATFRLDRFMDRLFMFLCVVAAGSALIVISSTVSSCCKHENDSSVAKTKLMLEHGFTEEDMEKWHNHEILTQKTR